jgi:hypothetical protein
MSGPENETPTRSTRSRSTPPSEPAAPPPASPPPSGTTSQPATAQASEAVSSAMSAVRERLGVGEQILLIGAAVIVAVYIIFQVILGHGIFFESMPVVVAALAVLAIWVHRWGHHDFGNGYRILLGAFGVVLLLFAFTNFLSVIRFPASRDPLEFLGLLLYWAGGAAALYGGWTVFRARA